MNKKQAEQEIARREALSKAVRELRDLIVKRLYLPQITKWINDKLER